MTTVDNSFAFVVPRLAAVVALAATAALLETPTRERAAARVLRGVVLAMLGGAAIAGVLAGPLGPLAGRSVWARRAIEPVCCETVSAVQMCDVEHDLRR